MQLSVDFQEVFESKNNLNYSFPQVTSMEGMDEPMTKFNFPMVSQRTEKYIEKKLSHNLVL